ncbi:DUF3040 domain-containing protein [Corynebacterium bovis]|uniref:DUF3040 domain-containing protein n=1 Tax=Corynebacterium bovis TaxID=36808 RepID=UPI00313A3461
MALSEQERRMLEEIENALIAEDPRFGTQARATGGGGFHLTVRVAAVMLLGLLALIGGVILAQNNLAFVILSAVGFLVMFGGGLMGFRATSGAGGAAPTGRRARRARAAAASGSRPAGRTGGLSDRMEESFRRRFQ